MIPRANGAAELASIKPEAEMKRPSGWSASPVLIHLSGVILGMWAWTALPAE